MHTLRNLVLAAAVGLLPACSGNGTVPPPQPQQVDFVQFARDELALTADDTDPKPINDLVFLDQFVEDTGLFADLFD